MATITTQLKINVLEAALANTPSIQICRENNITPDLLRAILSDHGWPNRKAVQWRVDVLTEDLAEEGTPGRPPKDPQNDGGVDAPGAPLDGSPPAPAAAPVEAATPAPPSPPRRDLPDPGPCEHVNLIRGAAKSPRTRTRNLGIKIEALLTELGTALAAERKARAEKDAAARATARKREQAKAQEAAARAATRAVKDAERAKEALAKLDEQTARLKAERDQVEARLAAAHEAAKNAPPAAPAETPAAVVRQWAIDNDVACPQTGRLPAHVRAAYEAAHKEAAA